MVRPAAMIGIVAWVGSLAWAGAVQGPVRVTGDRVNLRSGPSLESEVVSQVSKGETLQAVGSKGEWTQVVPRVDDSLWVYGELVQEASVAVPKLIVRAGPGINYRRCGQLVQGDKVEIRGEHNGWLRIAPPKGSYLWVSTAYLEEASSLPADKPAAGDGPVPDVRSPSSVPSAGRPAPKAIRVSPSGPSALPAPRVPAPGVSDDSKEADWRSPPSSGVPSGLTMRPPRIDPRTLAAARDQGVAVEARGVLRSASRAVWRRPSRYRLVTRGRQGRALTVCYVLGDEARLSGLLGKRLTVGGKQYWVQGALHPVIAVERLAVDG